MYIAKLPGYSDEEFEEFLDQNLPDNFTYQQTKLYESTVSLLHQKYTYYKLISSK